MAIKINGTNLPVGTKQYFNGTQIKDIIFNGVNVWHYDSVGPTIRFTSSTATTPVAAYTLTAIVTEADSGLASITINNVNYSIAYGAKSVNVSKAFTLSNGTNTFTIRATDIAGNVSTSSLSIVYANQKNDPNYNWTTLDNPTDSWRTYHVYVGGAWYDIYRYQWHTADSYTSPYANITSTIPLPKGIKSMSGHLTLYAAGDWSANGTVTIRDNTTGQVLYTNSAKSGFDFNVSFTKEQAVHDLSIYIDGHATGYVYKYGSAEVGLARSSGWSFTYY